MRKLIVQEFITLDGVMQAPGGPDEDKDSGFQYGGWTAPYFAEADAAAADFMTEWMRSTDILLGRKTFDIFASYWPNHTDMWPGINDVTKYVMTTTMGQSSWQNTMFLQDIDGIKSLKEEDGGDIKVHGSSNLVQSLFEHDLVDELRLITFPITLGTGKRLFAEGTKPAAYTMTDSLIAPNGVIFANYERTGDVKTGIVGA